MREADAALLADSLVTADLSGTHSHGVLRVPEDVKKLPLVVSILKALRTSSAIAAGRWS